MKKKSMVAEYLLHSSCTWEDEETFAVLNDCLVFKYTSHLLGKSDAIKIEEPYHIKSENDPGNYLLPRKVECAVCGMPFASKDDLNKHTCRNNVFKCYCNKQFKSSRDLIIHMRMHPEEKPYNCQYCEKRFSRSHSLQMHMRTHTHEKPYQCKYCDKQFARLDNLTTHVRTHTASMSTGCELYEKNGTCESNVPSHVDTLTQGFENPANNFNKELTKTINMTTDTGKHTFEKPYRCENCIKTFFTKYALKIHMQTHCVKLARQSGKLTNHPRADTDEEPQSCTFYDQQLSQNKGLVTLTRLEHGKLFQCKYCGMQFHTQGNLVTHVRSHIEEKPYKCEHCAMEFRTNGSLIVHLRSHDPEKEYKCNYCTMQFHSKGSLVVHMRTHHPGEAWVP